MIPHALRRLPSESVLPTVLAGIVLFFLLGRGHDRCIAHRYGEVKWQT
jgi:hypothetical protein